jgi:hypothetical protein
MWFDNPKVAGFMDKFQNMFGDAHLSYCVFWSDIIFKKELLRNKCLAYSDFVGYIRSERKNHGKYSSNNYSTVIEFNWNYHKITWKFKPSKSLRKKITGSFKVVGVYTDGTNIHMIYSQNGKSKYIKFEYNNIEITI